MDAMRAALAPLRIARLRVVFRSPDGLTLPQYQGSSVRGALAGALKGLVCVRPELRECAPCALRTDCAYPYLFETSAPAGERGTRGFESFPRPYIISYGSAVSACTPSPPRPEPGVRADRNTSVETELGLTLVGAATRYFPYMALALRDLQNRGIGRGRQRFELARVEALDIRGNRSLIYDGATSTLENRDAATTGEAALGLAHELAVRLGCSGRLSVRFLSPTALMNGGRPAAIPEFGLLLGAALRRLSMLALGHCAHRMELDFADLNRQARAVRLVRQHIRPVQWERYSSRQDRRVPMRGLVGAAEYEGDLAGFLSILLLGSFVHVGDNCAFGMGRYIVGIGGEWFPPGWQFPGEDAQHPEVQPFHNGG